MAPNPKATHDDTWILFSHCVFNGYGPDLGSAVGNHLASSWVKGMSTLWSLSDGLSMVRMHWNRDQFFHLDPTRPLSRCL